MFKLTSKKVEKFRIYLFAIFALSPGLMIKIFSGLFIVEGSAGKYFFVATGYDRLLYALPFAVFGAALGALIALQMAWSRIGDSDAQSEKFKAEAEHAREQSRREYKKYSDLNWELTNQIMKADERQADLQKQWLELGEAQRVLEGKTRHLATQIADQQRKNDKQRQNGRSHGGSQNPNPKPF